MDNNYKFDPMTGEPIVKEAAPAQPAAPQYEAPQAPAAPQYQQPVASEPAAQPSKGKAIAGMAIAICGLCFSWLGVCACWPGIFPLVASIVGWQLAKGLMPFSKVGKICGIIGMILSIIFMVVGIFVLIGLFAADAYGVFDDIAYSMYY